MSQELDFDVLRERLATVFLTFARESLRKPNLSLKQVNIKQLNSCLDQNSFQKNIIEAFNIFALMQALAEANDLAKSQFDKEKFKEDQWIAFTFIKNNTSKIEINLNGKLNSIYFPTGPECKFLSAVTIKEFNYNVD